MKKFELVELKRDNGVAFYAARLRPLGLTAYADTGVVAVEKLKKMASAFINQSVKRV